MAQIVIDLQNYFMTNYTQWIFVVIIFVVGFVVIRIVNKYLAHFFDRVDFDHTLEVFLQKTVRIFLWIILFVIILSNLGFNVSGFIAGLGIMGFIVGFATKDILSNLAAGIFLLIKRPFKVGDLVELAKIKGIVKEITISACVVVTEGKEYVTIPNAKIWGGPIKNLSKLKK